MGVQVSDMLDITPLFCLVCETAMVGQDDLDYHRLFQSCTQCGMKWAETNRAQWQMGWRPSMAEVAAEITNRRSHILNEIDILRG